MRLRLYLFVFVTIAAGARADENPSLRALTDGDIAAWSEQYGNALLTPDGKWLVYAWSAYDASGKAPRKGVPHVVVRQTSGDTERRYSMGELAAGAVKLKMSVSGRWIAYLQAGTTASETDAVVIELDTGNKRKFANVQDFRFAGRPDREWIAFQGPPEAASTAAYTLSLHRLGEKESELKWYAVQEYAFDGAGERLAWADNVGVHLLQLDSGAPDTIERGSGQHQRYSALTWSLSGRRLAMLRQNSGQGSLTIFTVTGKTTHRLALNVAQWPGFPQGYEIRSEPVPWGMWGALKDRILQWRDDEDGVFFNIQHVSEQPVAIDSHVAKLVLWHSYDERSPLVKKEERRQQRTQHWLAYVSLPQGRFVRLADEEFDTVLPQGRGQYALAYNWRAYGVTNYFASAMPGFQKRDYALTDLRTGRHTIIARALQVSHQDFDACLDPEPQLSPDGRILLYQDSAGHYHSYEISSGKRRALTAGLPVQFDRAMGIPWWKDSRAMGKADIPILSVQGWSADGRYVLISDFRDIWALPLRGGRAFNLTGNGSSDGIAYTQVAAFSGRKAHELDPYAYDWMADRRRFVDLKRPIYFAATDLKTLRTGLGRLLPGQTQVQMLSWEDAEAVYFKAEAAPVYLSQRRTINGYDYYRVDENGRTLQPLTDLFPQQRQFHWTKPRDLRYRTEHNDTLHGVLYPPMGAEAGRMYPAVVRVYEDVNGWLYGVSNPRNEIFRWLRQGYAVILPDIKRRIGEAGPAALESVKAAVDAAVATGTVDRARLGLYGHSYGGYEAFYLATQTDMFKAIVSMAGVANLQSLYGTLSFNDSGWMFVERGQPSQSGPWWEHREAYLRNSPLEHATNIHTPLLIAHGDADINVPFSQSMEMFSTLRRLERPVVLLQYIGEAHGVDYLPDAQQRAMQFYDHFLKGAPAPSWWTEGISYYDGQAPEAGSVDATADIRP